MPGRFITCQLCGQGFGSASIGIHVPQCHQKFLRRWQADDPRTRGPKPVMPGRQNTLPPKSIGSTSAPPAVSATPVMPSRVAISQHEQRFGQDPSPQEQQAGGANLNACRKCGRTFAFDRVRYHESVCKENARSRKPFNTREQRLSGFDSYDLGTGGGGGFGGRRGKQRGGNATMAMKKQQQLTASSGAANNGTSWRQQHNEFINAIRSAKQFTKEERGGGGGGGGGGGYSYGYTGGGGAQKQQRQPRQPYASSALSNPNLYRNPPASQQPQSSQYGARRAQQQLPRGTPSAAGGALAQLPQAQGQGSSRFGGSGGGGRRPMGGGGGGGGMGGNNNKINILNTNETSRAMLEAFGRV